MPFKVLRTGGSKTFIPHWMDHNNAGITLPTNTSFSAFTSDPNVGTAVMSGNNVVFTPSGTVTGNVYINCVATLPTGEDVYATILVHVTDNTGETTNYGVFSIA